MASTSRLRWAVNTSCWMPSEQEWVHGLSVIQSEEVRRVGEFAYQRDAKYALVGRLLIWAGLSEHMGGASNLRGYKLVRSERGKPVLLDATGCEDKTLSFNISHQGDYVVLATEPGGKVGVDIMKLSQPRNTSLQHFFCTMKKQFTTKEWAQIAPASIDFKKQLNNFYRFWCLKESFIKAEGSGLSYGLQNLEFICSSEWPPSLACCCDRSQLYIRGELAKKWKFQECMLNEHCISVAVHTDDNYQCDSSSLTFSLLTVQWLLSQNQTLLDHRSLATEWELFKQKQSSP